MSHWKMYEHASPVLVDLVPGDADGDGCLEAVAGWSLVWMLLESLVPSVKASLLPLVDLHMVSPAVECVNVVEGTDHVLESEVSTVGSGLLR